MHNIRLSARNLRRLMNLWPPFWAMGIRVEHIAEDYRHVRVRSRLRFYNQNYVRTHFGGTLFAMTDPFFMLMLMHRLGKGYRVWDKRAQIEFVRPGKGTVRADFYLSDEQLQDVLDNTQGGEKYFPRFYVSVRDASGDVVAEVQKTLYVRAAPARTEADG